MNKKAVILLSGGLDSATVLAIAQSNGFECHTMSFDYGQRHRSELEASKELSALMEAKSHKIIQLDLQTIGGSALTDNTIDVPDYGASGIPQTYVPARNTLFLSLALGWAEVLGARDIFIGANNIDYSGYPDCRPEYIQAFEAMANLATKAGVEGDCFRIQAPLLDMSKAEVIKEGSRLGVEYGITISCYQADEQGRACGHCDSCHYRMKGFQEAGLSDPTRYQSDLDH